jgi:hypothetical protein
MTTTYIHRCMIVAASQQGFAQDVCRVLGAPGGGGMFVRGLSASGLAPATHFISAGSVQDTFAGVLSAAAILHGVCQQQAANPQFTDEGRAFLAGVTLAQCQALLAASDVSTDAPLVAISRKGLKLIQEAL